jgi:dienelactone hydrolase
MRSQSLSYTDGTLTFDSLLVTGGTDLAAPRPGILVFPEAWGLAEHAIERAERLAGLGYVALAVDPYGARAQARDPMQAREFMGDMMSDAKLRLARGSLALKALLEQKSVDRNRVGAIGFCFGGTMVLDLARSGAELAAVASFHGGLETNVPAEPGAIRAKILVCAGADDKAAEVPKLEAFLAEMRAAQADHQVIVYGDTVHSFTNPAADGSNPGVKYNPVADRRSWAAMCALFEEAFGLAKNT